MQGLDLYVPRMAANSAVASVVFSFWYSISEEDYPLWRYPAAAALHELLERYLHHLLQRFNNLNPRLLNVGQGNIFHSTWIIRKYKPGTGDGFATPGPGWPTSAPGQMLIKGLTDDHNYKRLLWNLKFEGLLIRTMDSLKKLQPPRRAFILRLRLKKGTSNQYGAYIITSRLRCSSTDCSRPRISPTEGIESWNLKTGNVLG